MGKNVPILEMFPCCGHLINDTDQIEVTAVEVYAEKQRMSIRLLLPDASKPVAPVTLSLLEEVLCREYGLLKVELKTSYKNPVEIKEEIKKEVSKNGNKAKFEGSRPRKSDSAILGRPITGKAMEIGDVTLESGSVIVKGRVFEVSHREITKINAWVLSFCVTDYTGSIHVSKFMKEKEEMESIVEAVKKDTYVTVQGEVSFNRYEGDMVLEPKSIVPYEKASRQDKAPEKRVELHMHTRFSAMDGLTDAAEAVKLAAAWGHSAIAITDHGVAQAFPDACKAGKKCGIKILYGVEAYYINDVDDKIVFCGEKDVLLTDEFVAFDIETTGLNPEEDRITEIGAVIYRNGEQGERFQTFVNPQKPIPEKITRLTGIRDSDVQNAPSQKAALEAFLAFIGEKPLAAHNAEFDMGFIAAGCAREGISFSAGSVDTLALSQSLLPELKHHKLNQVADYLSLPDFSHHRAVDDAVTVAHILSVFFPRLMKAGITGTGKINDYAAKLRKNQKASRGAKHIILLAKNQEGLRNLYKLISLSHLEHFKRFPIVPKSLLMENRAGLIIGSACEAGEVFTAIVRGKSKRELLRLASFYDFLEIQPICNNEFMLFNEKGTPLARDREELREFNRKICRLAKELNKPVVATGDVHFLDPEQEIYRSILLASKGFTDADRKLPLYLKTTDEMLSEFSYLGEELAYDAVVRYPNQIADSCEAIKPLPNGLFTPTIQNSAEELKKLVYGKMRELYGENPPQVVTDRVEVELTDIINSQYDVIYMSAQKLVAKSLEAGYLVGSRGSVGSSLVAFMSGITEVNSLPAHYRCPQCKHSDFEAGHGFGCGADMPDKTCPVCGNPCAKDGFDIPFATFLGFGGDKIPDIDLNFSGEYQARAHRETFALFGEDHVFRAGTIGTVAEKTAFGFVKKYLEERGLKVTRAEEKRLTAGCVGVKRTTGQHPGGLVVIPQDKEIYDFCPVQRPADSEDTDIITTHFEYHSMEDNLLKLDLLGHDDPTMIRMLQDLTGINPQQIPLDDPETMSIFKSPSALGIVGDDPIIGKTGSIAVPEFGTKFTREMLVDTQPETFDVLVRLSGFSHGTDVWLGNAKDLIVNGVATVKEVIGSRDDIMLYLIGKGMEEKLAFKIMESVRKGRGLLPEWEESMSGLGVPQWYVESCKKIKYMFPKAHAVAYVMMAFRIAWFKVHYPLAFYCAYFTVRAKAFDAAVMTRGIDTVVAKIREIESKMERQDASAVEKEMLTTLEVCYEFYLRGGHFAGMELHKADAVRFLIEGDGLIPPFTAIAGLGETAARDLVANRNRGFISIEELSASCPKVSKTHIEQLKSLGVLDGLPETSQLSLF